MRGKRAGAAGTACRGAGLSGRWVLMAEAALLGGVVLALLCRELPSLRREARIWRIAGGFRAGHRYP